MHLIAGLSTEKYLLYRISTILSSKVHQIVIDARINLLRVDTGTNIQRYFSNLSQNFEKMNNFLLISYLVAAVDFQKIAYELEVAVNQILSCVCDVIPKGAQAVRNVNLD